MATNYATWDEADLEARHQDLSEAREAMRVELSDISAELGNRERDRQLAREAERYSDADLARMAALRQEIKPAGVASGEVFGVPGARG